MKNAPYIFQLLRRYFGRLLVVFFFSFLSVILSVTVFMMIEPFCSLLFRGSLDGLSPISSFFVSHIGHVVNLDLLGQSMLALIVAAILLYLFKNLFGYAAQWVMASVRSDFLYSIRNALYDKILHLPLSFFSRQRSGDVVSRAVNDTHEIEFTILTALKTFLIEPITAIIYIVVLFCIHAKLTLYALLLLPITFVIIGYLARSLRRDAKTSKQRLGSLLAHVEESLGGLRIIKGFNAQDNANRVFGQLNRQFSDKQRKVYRKIDIASPLSEFLGVSVVMVVLVIGGMMVLSPSATLTAELFITYIALFTQVINPVKNISNAQAQYKRGLSALDRLNEILSVDDEVSDDSPSLPLPPFSKGIVFEHLTFAYSDRPVLEDVSFELRKGETVALVGQSGAGKSTLADLLERFYDPSAGAVLMDGVDIRQYDLHQYRARFSLVSQDVVLFHDTIYNNIVMGMSGVTEADVVKATKTANIYDFIMSLPDGFAHDLSDRGLNLSGGQRQRISIARAVLRNTPLLILDEATSAMDTESERAVQAALDNIMQNRTVLVIAHRLSTVRNANRIIVLDQGRVVEQGSHDELLAQGGVYGRMVKGEWGA